MSEQNQNGRGPDGRPSPDGLLQEQERRIRGQLKIFLGAAPGVGKTYEMLVAAHAQRAEGRDVVVGVVETHGRRETEALLAGLEVIPRRSLSYKGQTLSEMDIDAILQRHPQLVLVDELAHTNAPGSRHPKRYLDVEELLAAGIDVYSTLNIQHVESLNDVVARITRIRVRETVPDSILDRADDIEVIDLTPDDLIKRLKDGKVYVPRQAERAIAHYFSRGNLTALRELALRRTAQRVDQQMVDYMRTHAIQGPWAAGERILACVDTDESGPGVVRSARRLADQMRAGWCALHIETARSLRMSEAERNRVAETLRLAERLGAEAVTIPGHDVAQAVIDYARANNFTHVVVGRARRGRWAELLHHSLALRLTRRAVGMSVHVVAEERGTERAPPRSSSLRARLDGVGGPSGGRAYIGSLGLVAAALGLAMLLHRMLAVSDLAIVFLIPVLASAIGFGLWPSLLACLASVLAYNFFFLPPLYTFTISDPENVVALTFFAAVALVVSNLAARVRDQAVAARRRARTTEDLYLFSRKLAEAARIDDLLWATAYQVARMLQVRVVVLLPGPEGLAVQAGYPPEDRLDEADMAAAKWCFEHNRPAGRGADTLPGAKRLFLPMQTGRGAVGVLGIDRDEPGPMLTPEQSRLLNAIADQAALAIERVHLAEDVERGRLAAETDRLRSALLTSISHDLRTPLASILGCATSLASQGEQLEAEVRLSLIRTIQDEAERLNRFIGNLLDMTRIESGPLLPQAGLADLSDVIGATLQRAHRILAQHRVELALEADLPMVAIDMVLFEQTLFNLLDNAAKYAPADSLIRIAAWRENGRVLLQVTDEGEGIPPGDLDRIFDKFYRVHGADRRRAGTGLGLPICRGFVEAMGGQISAANRTDRRGAVFTISLPVPAQAALTEAPAG